MKVYSKIQFLVILCSLFIASQELFWIKKKSCFYAKHHERGSICTLLGKKINNTKKPAFKNYCLSSSHVRSFYDFTVLNYESNKFKRLVKESLLVTKDQPLLSLFLSFILLLSLIMFYFFFESVYKNQVLPRNLRFMISVTSSLKFIVYIWY